MYSRLYSRRCIFLGVGVGGATPGEARARRSSTYRAEEVALARSFVARQVCDLRRSANTAAGNILIPPSMKHAMLAPLL